MSNKRENYLALCLVEAVEDENYDYLKKLLINYRACPNTIIYLRHVAAIHLVIGADNENFSEKATLLMLQHGGDPNLVAEDAMTPLHIAAHMGRAKIVDMLLDHGANIDLVDDDGKTATEYAVCCGHLAVVKVIKKHIFESKIERKKEDLKVKCLGGYLTLTPSKHKSTFLDIQSLEENKYTPKGIHYNFDATSPYFINITHRKKKEQTKTQKENINTSIQNMSFNSPNEPEDESPNCRRNLFELTEDNLQEFTRNASVKDQKSLIIESWREKVAELRRRSLIHLNLDKIDDILSNFNDSVEETFITANDGENVVVPENENDVNDEESTVKLAENEIVEVLDDNVSEGPNNTYTLLTEEYVHTDAEEGIVIYEKKYVDARQFFNDESSLPKLTAHQNALNSSMSSLSTAITVPPLDYDTDALRNELTQFGEAPGPITKTTKKLYLKKLAKFKKDPRRQMNNCVTKEPIYSVELQSTMKDIEKFTQIMEKLEFEQKMIESFNEPINRKRREGHLKTSFIYFLMDPRISDKLSIQKTNLTEHELWKKFLPSIFYVGKGKLSRPHAHLYEAMKLFAQKVDSNELKARLQNKQNHEIEEKIIFRSEDFIPKFVQSAKIQNRKDQIKDSKKLNRILDIWQSGNGVVSLHVFHNIMPEEAFTREAAIIESIGIKNLTNLKKGDFYGVSKTWPMKAKKILGNILLYRAMQIHLAGGESQLFPTDLI